jgi:hypothetical protein
MSNYTAVRPHVVFAYHGCDKHVGETILRGGKMLPAHNDYDWLGSGSYFWEADPARAMKWAQEAKHRHTADGKQRAPDKTVRDPYVLGAVVSYGECLDMTTFNGGTIVRDGYSSLLKKLQKLGEPVPENTAGEDMKGRFLDCAVINHTCAEYLEKREIDFDTVRAVFLEGKVLYNNAGFREKTHTQLCVRREEAILGFFRLREQPVLEGI